MSRHFEPGTHRRWQPHREVFPPRAGRQTGADLKSPVPSPKRAIPRCLLPAACCLLALGGGCSGSQPDSDGTSGRLPLAGVKLRLLVAGDPELAAAAGQLKGEWNAQTGSDFQVESIAEEQFDNAASFAADALVCPSHQLGTLAERQLLAPVPKRLLEGNVGDRPDVFRLLRLGEAIWGGETLGVPFGSPVLTCYYRADLLEKLRRKPPETWVEYQELAELLADRRNLGDAAPPDGAPWCGTIEPLAPGWAGLVLLARSAPYAKHPDNYSTCFDVRTMRPLVAGPPFVRALEELVAAAKVGPPDPLQDDPADARAAFWGGRCGMALTWPTAAAGSPADTAPNVRVGFAELPGATKVFNVYGQSWELRAEDDDPHVPLLAIAGRIGVVARKSAHPEAAFQLLSWLSGTQFSPRVCASSGAATLFRQSHLADPQTWVEKPTSPSAAAQYAAAARSTFSHQHWVFALRIPGRSEYLAALDGAVRRAVRGEQSPDEALRQAVTRWQEITERLGPDRQKAAYAHSLGQGP